MCTNWNKGADHFISFRSFGLIGGGCCWFGWLDSLWLHHHPLHFGFLRAKWKVAFGGLLTEHARAARTLDSVVKCIRRLLVLVSLYSALATTFRATTLDTVSELLWLQFPLWNCWFLSHRTLWWLPRNNCCGLLLFYVLSFSCIFSCCSLYARVEGRPFRGKDLVAYLWVLLHGFCVERPAACGAYFETRLDIWLLLKGQRLGIIILGNWGGCACLDWWLEDLAEVFVLITWLSLNGCSFCLIGW